MRSFFKPTASHFKEKLPLGNELLRQLGCLNATKRHKQSTVLSIQNIASVLQAKVNSMEVVNGWKVFQVDSELPSYNPSERIEAFWNGVFQLQSSGSDLRYKLLPVVIKCALVPAQTNAETECSLSVNARIVTQERTSLSEKTIVGLHVMKELSGCFVWFANDQKRYQLHKILRKNLGLPMQHAKNE